MKFARVLQNRLKYFNGTIVLIIFLLLAPVLLVIFCLNLNKALLPGKLSVTPEQVKADSSL